MANVLNKIIEVVLPKKKQKAGGVSVTNTYAGNDEVLTLPSYTAFLDDLQSDRVSEEEFELIDKLCYTDSDVSAALNAYLTLSDTKPIILAFNKNGELDRKGIQIAEMIMDSLFEINDYSLGYQMKPTFREWSDQVKYMLLTRGSVGAELVYDKMLRPKEIRIVDMATVEFKEKNIGEYKPVQSTDNQSDIDLDIPTFFTVSFRQNPTDPYSHSYFAPAINTIAARQKVINDLYRILNITGFPRLSVKVLEQVLLKNCPKTIVEDERKKSEWVNNQLLKITGQITSLNPQSPIVHTDSVEMSIINERMAGASLQISDVISTLNAANTSSLKTVSTVLGRGEVGVNTASTETIVFSKHANAFNRPVQDLMSRILTLAARLSGFDGKVSFTFTPVELRPETELENQKTMLQTRMLQQLSLGLITDDYFHLIVNNRLGSEKAPLLSGTGFMDKNNSAQNEGDSDIPSPLDRALTPENETSSKSNSVDPNKNN